MYNLECETHTTVCSNSQLTLPMAFVLESLVPVQAVVASLSSISWLLVSRLPVHQAAWLLLYKFGRKWAELSLGSIPSFCNCAITRKPQEYYYNVPFALWL